MIPPPTLELIETVRLRWLAVSIGLEKLYLKNNKLVGYFIANQASAFYQSELFTKVLASVQKNPRIVRMRESNEKLSLVFENVKTISEAKVALTKISSI